MSHFKRKLLTTLFIPLLLAVAPALACGQTATGATQEDIRALVQELTDAGSEARRQAVFEDAADLAGEEAVRRVAFLEQLTLFLASATGTEEAMGGALLLHALEFQRDEILEATLPRMVEAGPKLNKVLREIAATAVRPDSGDDPIVAVLEVERLRHNPDAGAGAENRKTENVREMLILLARLEQDDNTWVKAYAAAVKETGDSQRPAPRN